MRSLIDRVALKSARARTVAILHGGAPSPAPAVVFLLADHLDAVLAMGEDMGATPIVWDMADRKAGDDVVQTRHEVRASIESIRALELAIVARVLTARRRAAELARRDTRFGPLAEMFVAATAVLADAAEECGDTTAQDFDTADGIIAYLRSRGLVAVDAPAPSEGGAISVSDEFLIARRIALGPLMDLVARFLDTMETHYTLFEADEDERPDALVETAAAGAVAASEADEAVSDGDARAELDLALAAEAGIDGEGECDDDAENAVAAEDPAEARAPVEAAAKSEAPPEAEAAEGAEGNEALEGTAEPRSLIGRLDEMAQKAETTDRPASN